MSNTYEPVVTIAAIVAVSYAIRLGVEKISDYATPRLNRRLEDRIANFLAGEGAEKLIVEPAIGVYNNKCFHNAVNAAYFDKNLEVCEVIYRDIYSNRHFLHYIVRDTVTGVYKEVSIGYLAIQHEYFLIRVLTPEQCVNIEKTFSDQLEAFNSMFLTRTCKLFDIDRSL